LAGIRLSTLYQNIVVPLASLALLVWAYLSWSWMGLAMAVTAMVMWLLLHYTRLMHIFKLAANRPIGHVDSAVMLHVKLKPNMPLIKVIALTKSLGAVEVPMGSSPANPVASSETPYTPEISEKSSSQAQAAQPNALHPELGAGVLAPSEVQPQPLKPQWGGNVKEVFIWRDAQASFVRCEFEGGRLKAWALSRPEPQAEPAA
jgi:hypothetical protein